MISYNVAPGALYLKIVGKEHEALMSNIISVLIQSEATNALDIVQDIKDRVYVLVVEVERLKRRLEAEDET